MIHVVYRWEVTPENRQAFLIAWRKTTLKIRESTPGARGSFCIANVEKSTEIFTIAKWDQLDQWREFVKIAKFGTMKEMHALGTQLSHDAYEQMGDFTI